MITGRSKRAGMTCAICRKKHIKKGDMIAMFYWNLINKRLGIPSWAAVECLKEYREQRNVHLFPLSKDKQLLKDPGSFRHD